MKKGLISNCLLILMFCFFTSCATIVGGNKYWAHVEVPNRSDANIIYKGQVMGNGKANFKVKRAEANKFTIIVKSDGCDEQEFYFHKSGFRGWALVGTIITWTGIIPPGIPLPWGLVVDVANGALMKPNKNEKGISKIDYKHYSYVIDYKGCEKD